MQLGQSGLISDHLDCSLFVPAMLQTCLQAQTWNMWGTVVSASCTMSQSTLENWVWVKIPASLNSDRARFFVSVESDAGPGI